LEGWIITTGHWWHEFDPNSCSATTNFKQWCTKTRIWDIH
jgi:hypothetical protein